ncbi:hypothetical protein OAH64_03335 [bacterium]|nr:hypothetical protein [bacterium]MDB4672884.1 hypothetical protein [Akkermansiaceae bacterium]
MNETKKRAGRPFNSVTTVKVKMIDLLGVVLPECEVVVGRKWADSVGVLDKCFLKQQVEQELRIDTLFD